jgi:hypothetical protein
LEIYWLMNARIIWLLLVLRQNQRQLDEMASELQGMGGA